MSCLLRIFWNVLAFYLLYFQILVRWDYILQRIEESNSVWTIKFEVEKVMELGSEWCCFGLVWLFCLYFLCVLYLFSVNFLVISLVSLLMSINVLRCLQVNSLYIADRYNNNNKIFSTKWDRMNPRASLHLVLCHVFC